MSKAATLHTNNKSHSCYGAPRGSRVSPTVALSVDTALQAGVVRLLCVVRSAKHSSDTGEE